MRTKISDWRPMNVNKSSCCVATEFHSDIRREDTRKRKKSTTTFKYIVRRYASEMNGFVWRDFFFLVLFVYLLFIFANFPWTGTASFLAGFCVDFSLCVCVFCIFWSVTQLMANTKNSFYFMGKFFLISLSLNFVYGMHKMENADDLCRFMN